LPQEDGGMLVLCSTQHPSEMQHVVAHALGRPAHAVQVVCRRMGGGFGGKESQSALCLHGGHRRGALQPAGEAAVDRDDDFLITGRGTASLRAAAGFDDQGRILGAEVTMVSRAGHSADLSGPVMTRALCHFDNAYWLPHVADARLLGQAPTPRATPPSAASAGRRARSPSST
jgi:xanthine dehydrogenase large subunit